MSTPELHPRTSWGTIASAQLRMLALLQRRDFVVLGAIVAMLTAFALWGITHAPPAHNASNGAAMVFTLLAIPFGIVGAFWPLGVWRAEAPERRGYFWSLPSPRGPHTLVRVGVGWVLLMIACLAVMVVALVLAEVAAARLGPAELSWARWYVPLATGTLAYVLVSWLTVLFDGPVRVLAWTVVAVIGLQVVAQVTRLAALARPIHALVTSFFLALAGPIADEGPEIVVNGTPYTVAFSLWVTHYVVWMAVGVAALVLAAFWHRDAR